MSEVRIPAEPRTQFGKGSARRTRRDGKVPAVLYGHGTDPKHISLPARELMHAFKGESGTNVLLHLDLPGGAELALPRQVQRDPLRGDLTHVDLLLVRRGEKVAVDVPIVVMGEPAALKLGGLLEQPVTVLHVEAEATAIPTQVDVDAALLAEVGATVYAKDVVLPEGSTLLSDPDTIIAHIFAAPTAEQFEESVSDQAAGTVEPTVVESGGGAAEGE